MARLHDATWLVGFERHERCTVYTVRPIFYFLFINTTYNPPTGRGRAMVSERLTRFLIAIGVASLFNLEFPKARAIVLEINLGVG